MIRHDVVQGSIEWHELRVGKITSTRLKQVMSKDNLALIDELIAEQELGYSDDAGEFISDAMQWGLDHEPLAIEAYEQLTGNKCEVVGMLESSEIPLLTVSPDRLVGSDGAVEVKCLKTKNHIKAIRQGGVPNDYRHQVLQYFIVHDGLKWLDFVSFDPRLTRKPIYVHRIWRKDIQLEIDDALVSVRKFVEKLEKYKQDLFF